MLILGPGKVTLSDRRTQSSWDVELERFSLSRTTVTQDLWRSVSAGASHLGSVEPNKPQHSISWWQAAQFCNALSRHEGITQAYLLDEEAELATWDRNATGYRLPTEAEWEYACRAGTTRPRHGPVDDIAWYRANSAGRLHEVGTLLPNAWGLHDMLGNVWEWCWDFYDPAVYGTYRVLRGGGWADEQWSVRAGVRRRGHPTFRIDDVGVRLARSL
jgi:sulfatase modifying factor 1